MKKKILLFIGLLLLPTLVNAKEYCTIVSGNGKSIGSEIACGTEHFYIINNDENNIKMLSKYNLYVGANYNKIKVDSNIYVYNRCVDSNCNSITGDYLYFFEDAQVENQGVFFDKIEGKYNIDNVKNYITNEQNSAIVIYVPNYEEKKIINGVTYLKENIKLYPYTVIHSDTKGFAMQNKLALGVTGEKGNANYPIYATLPVFPGNYDNYGNFVEGDSPEESTNNYDNFEDGYVNFEFNDNSRVYNYLNEYKNKLNSIGYEVSDVDMINIKELNELTKKISGKYLPLANWYNISLEKDGIEDENGYYYELGDLKKYLSNDYKWLWSSSYWTKTFVGNYDSNSTGYLNPLYFVSSSGEICYSGSDCYMGIPRAGIRPVITLSKDQIKYNIYTKTDGNGEIEVVDSAFGGEAISFRVSAKKGLKLSGLTVTTDAGEKIEFREEDLTTNKDGTISISTNKFTMPFDNVTIEARWSSISDIVNPKTGMKVGGLILLFTTITGITIYLRKKRSLQS